MGRKQEYKETNLEFLKELSSQEGVYALPCGIYYKVLETGTGTVFPNVRSIVTVHYKGSLIIGCSIILMNVIVRKLSASAM